MKGHSSPLRCKKLSVLVVAAIFVILPEAALASTVTITISGVYAYTGNAPSPDADFSLSFTVDKSPAVCGGNGGGTSILCGVSEGHYVDGSVDTRLGVSTAPTLLVRDTAEGGGLEFVQNDLPLNRLSFFLGSAQLFSGSVSSPTLVDGVYSIFPNASCSWQTGCNYVSYAGQSFAAGDTQNNPFYDPNSLQADDPLTSGTITISAAVAATPLPAALPLFVTGLGTLGLVGWRRKRKAQVAA